MPQLKQSSCRTIAILLTLFILIALVPIYSLITKAEGIWSGDYEYTVLDESDKTAALTGYRGDGPDVIVPDIIDGYTIVEITQDALSFKTFIETIVIPNSVKRIDYYAFGQMYNLKSVTLPDSISYMDIQAFTNCKSLENVILPKTMTALPGFTFQGCTSLKNIDLPDGLISIGDGAFLDCESLVDIEIPSGVNTIGSFAFQNCKSLKNMVVPDAVTSLDSQVFYNCVSLESISLPDSLESIGGAEFLNCSSLKSISLPDSLSGEIPHSAFNGCSSLTEITIPNSIYGIEEYAFRDCLNLSSVSFGNNLGYIGSYAFLNCPSLHELTIPAFGINIQPEAIGYLFVRELTDEEKIERDIPLDDFSYDYYNESPCLTEQDNSFIIRGFNGSTAETYALQNSFQFISLGDDPTKIELISEKGVDLFSKQYTNLCVRNNIWNPSDYLFKFIVYNNDSKQWYKLRDFGESNEFYWYTGPVGHKTLYVDIVGKEWYQNDPEFALKNKLRISLDNVVVTDYGLKVDSIVSSAGTELEMKTHTTLTATASNGVGDLLYKFIVHNEDNGQWYKIQDFSPNNTCDWFTGPAGHKTLYVDVKDANDVVVRRALDNIVVS